MNVVVYRMYRTGSEREYLSEFPVELQAALFGRISSVYFGLPECNRKWGRLFQNSNSPV